VTNANELSVSNGSVPLSRGSHISDSASSDLCFVNEPLIVNSDSHVDESPITSSSASGMDDKLSTRDSSYNTSTANSVALPHSDNS